MGDRQQPLALLAVQDGAQGAALQVLRDQERQVLLAPVVDGDEVGVVQRRRGLGLGLEATQEHGVVGQRRVQHLDRHAAAELHVVGHVDLGGRAGTDQGREPVPIGEHPTDQLAHRCGSHGQDGTERPPPSRGPLAGPPGASRAAELGRRASVPTTSAGATAPC